jgi:hypothetical protein
MRPDLSVYSWRRFQPDSAEQRTMPRGLRASRPGLGPPKQRPLFLHSKIVTAITNVTFQLFMITVYLF